VTPAVEVHVEQLLGRIVRDSLGDVVGRIEELATAAIDGRLVVMEVHVGADALIERLGGLALSLPFLEHLPILRWEYRIDSLSMNLSVPDRPRTLCAKRELVRSRKER
jgi:hypothetical protein